MDSKRSEINDNFRLMLGTYSLGVGLIDAANDLVQFEMQCRSLATVVRSCLSGLNEMQGAVKNSNKLNGVGSVDAMVELSRFLDENVGGWIILSNHLN